MKIKAALFTLVSIASVILASTVIVLGVKGAYSLASSYGEKTERTIGKYQMVVVTTPSMHPAMKVGSISFIKLCKQEDIEVGNIVMYRNKYDENIVHRVIGISNIDNKIYFETKGDANLEADGVLIDSNRYIGRVSMTMNWIAPFIKPLITGSVVEYAVFKFIIILAVMVYLLYKIIRQLVLFFRAVYYVFIDRAKYNKYLDEFKDNIKDCEIAYQELRNNEKVEHVGLFKKMKYSSHLSKMIDSIEDIKDNKKAVERRIKKCKKIKK